MFAIPFPLKAIYQSKTLGVYGIKPLYSESPLLLNPSTYMASSKKDNQSYACCKVSSSVKSKPSIPSTCSAKIKKKITHSANSLLTCCFVIDYIL